MIDQVQGIGKKDALSGLEIIFLHINENLVYFMTMPIIMI